MSLSPYHDWQLAFDKFFVDQNMSNLSIIELGKGEGTRYLCEKFKRVYSIEYSRFPFTASWEKNGLPNHTLETMQTPDNLFIFDNILISTKGQVRPHELEIEAQKLYDATEKYSADVLFIDHGCHNRGEVLELAKKGNWKYIIIHDSNFPYYGYQLSSKDHIVSAYKEGQGTVFFQKKNDYKAVLLPIITVIIPSVGRSSLKRALKSLVVQTNQIWIAKVGFDGLEESSEECKNITNDITDEERKVIQFLFLSKVGGGKNHGGAVRNKLMETCSTPWICFLDDDDTFKSNYMEIFQVELSNHPESDVIMFRMSYDKEEQKVLPPENLNQIKMNSVGISFAVRKEFLQKHGIQFINGSVEDYIFLKSVEDKGGKIRFSNHIVYNVRF